MLSLLLRTSAMRLIGHRGASAVLPENTLRAMQAALDAGAGFETDLQLSACGSVLCLHDDSLWRTHVPYGRGMHCGPVRAQLRAPVRGLSHEAVRRVDVGDARHAETVPTFASALHLLSSHDGDHAHLFAELKADGEAHDAELARAAAAAARQARVGPARLSWISFDAGLLREVKREMPSHAALLVAEVRSEAEAFEVARRCVDERLDGVDLNADASCVTRPLVEWLHARGKAVAVWVWRAPASNDHEAVWRHMDDVGVDAFTSNLPPAVLRWAASRSRGAPSPR